MELPEHERQALLDAIYKRQTIDAVRRVRDVTGCGLKEAKDFVDRLAAELYAKDPGKFAADPGKRGCLGLVAMITICTVLLLIAGALVRKHTLF